MNGLKKIYSEEKEPISPSDCEVIVFCISFICALCLVGELTLCSYRFEIRHLSLLLPAVFWTFVRASRKSMDATSIMISGSIGAIIGAFITILTKRLG